MPNSTVNSPAQSSLWSRTSREAPLDTSAARGTLKAEVAVVGGGYTGLSTALHLAEGGARVALFEAGEIGAGASGLNGGQVIPGLKLHPAALKARFPANPGMSDLFGGAADTVFDLVQRYRIACDPERDGWIFAAHASRAMAAVEDRFAQWSERGADVAMLTAQDMRALTGSDVYAGGMIDRRAGTVQPLAYARGLGRALLDRGGVIHEASRVRRMERHGAGWRLEGSGFSVEAGHVVIATDAYSDGLWPKLRRSLLVVNSIQIATEPVKEADMLSSRACMSETRKLAVYLRRDRDGRLLIGGRGPVGDTVPERLYDDLKQRLTYIFPKARDLKIEYRWQGRVGLTTDELPHIHQPDRNLHIALGYNGRGVAAATTMGRILADRILGGPLANALPVTPLTSIPLRLVRQPVLAAAIGYFRLRDRLGFGG